MTRAPATATSPAKAAGRAPSPARTGRVAALHRQGEHWRLVVVDIAATGAAVIDARTMPRGDAAAVRAALSAHGEPRLVRVLPAGACVCRLIAVPEGPASEMDAALHLIAEASLPATAPAHRRGAGLLPMPTEPGKRGAAIVAWAGDADDAPIAGASETWTAEPVALAALLGASGDGLVLYADAAAGSVSVAARGASRGVLRSLREHADSADAWELVIAERAVQAMRASDLDVDNTRGFVASPQQQLRAGGDIEPTILAGVEGVRREPAWLGQFGVALGAALASASTPGLCAMTLAPRAERKPIIESFATWLASPRRAAAIIAAGLAIALLAPLGAALVRQSILTAKSGGLDEQRRVEEATALRAAFYQELEKRRWPVSKLLGDLAGALPVGIEVDSLRMEVGERMLVQGVAPSLEVVNQLQTRLSESGVFAEASVDRTQTLPDGAPGVRFDVSARVVRPAAQPKGLEDFATQTLAQRLYGDRASAVASSSEASSDGAPVPRASRRARTSESGDAGSSRTAERTRSTEAPARKVEVPEPISDEQIAALDASAAMREWTTRQRASKQSGVDQPTRDRLKAEADKARARMQAARAEKPAAAPASEAPK